VSLEFFIDIILPAAASNRNEYREIFLWGKGGRCVGLETLPLLCDDCLEISEPQPLKTLRACPGLYRDCSSLLLRVIVTITAIGYDVLRTFVIDCDRTAGLLIAHQLFRTAIKAKLGRYFATRYDVGKRSAIL